MTPRIVYAWFKRIYQICYTSGLVGYVIIMLEIFGVTPLFFTRQSCVYLFSIGILLLFYGLYFGVLGRDTVELLADRMASTIGYYNSGGLPNKHLRANVCAICGDSVDNDNSSNTDEASIGGRGYQLDCRHMFHESCIRGWCLIGKKSMCPYCKEKVDMKQFITNPWDTQQALYLQLLDLLRYFIVWQPLIFLFAQLVISLSGLK